MLCFKCGQERFCEIGPPNHRVYLCDECHKPKFCETCFKSRPGIQRRKTPAVLVSSIVEE